MRWFPIRYNVCRLAAAWLVLAGSSWSVPGQEAPAANGTLVPEPADIQLGSLYDFPVCERDILLLNQGEQPVGISAVGVSCELCLDYELSNQLVPPGDVAVLKVFFDPLGYDGDVEHNVHVFTGTGEATKRINIPLQADVRPAWKVHGGPISFEELARSEERTMAFLLRPAMDSFPDLAQATVEDPGFTADIEPIGPGPGYRLTVRSVPSSLREGVLRSKILLHEDEGGPVVGALPLTALVPPSLHVAPKRLVLDGVDREQLRIIFLEQTMDDPRKLLDVQVPDEHFRFRVFPDFSLPNYRINVYSRRLGQKSGDVGAVVLKLAGDPEREVEVPIFVREPPGGKKQSAEEPVEAEGKQTCKTVGPTRSPAEVVGELLREHFGSFGMFSELSGDLDQTPADKP